MRKTLVTVGMALVLAGVLWPWLTKIPLGRLPGDVVIERPGLRVFFPITTIVVVSIVVSLLFRLFRK